MRRQTIPVAALAALLAITACTGGDMGNTRGGGAAPGQAGGSDTGRQPAAGTVPGAATVGASARAADTTKTRAPGRP